MPELPEVESIRRRLLPIVGKVIKSVKIARPEMIKHPSPSRLAKELKGRRIKSLRRRGKYLLFHLDRDKTLVLHLGMSGNLRLLSAVERDRESVAQAGTLHSHSSTKKEGGGGNRQYERIRFELSGGEILSFEDMRTFGKVFFYGKEERPPALAGMAAMGREPIERGFSPAYLAERFRNRKTAVKNLLLDQRICCGVGNIYANEALHRAGIRPDRPAKELTRVKLEELARALRTVVREGIRWCGTTLDDDGYKLPDGGRGGFQRHLRVVGRAGKQCRCGGVVERIILGGRSSYFCPQCQS